MSSATRLSADYKAPGGKLLRVRLREIDGRVGRQPHEARDDVGGCSVEGEGAEAAG
jgi:hypothetical protein